LFLAGCAMTPYSDTSAHSLSIKGTAFGGQPPVTGSAIVLYATGGTGYGSGPTFLGGTSTDLSGNFQINSAIGCSDPQQVYIVATGGNPGLTAGTNNNALVLVAALGNCSSVSASTHVIINEVTTIAAAYALSGFSDVTSSNVNIGTSGTNSLGLQHAFQNAANIVDFGGGSARATTPAGNGTVPTNVINSLADILEPCVNSTSKTSTPCTSLFTNATPPSGFGVAPVNTWQAALDMAQFPGNNTAALYGLILATPSFQPTLGGTAPNDLSLGVTYTAGLGYDGVSAATGPWGIAADATDNIWVSGANKAGLIELNSVGALLSPNGGWGNTALQTSSGSFTHQVAVDLKGNIWTVDSLAAGGNIYQYNPGSATTTVTTPGTVALAGVAVDASNNIWYSTKASSGTQVFGQLAYNSGSNTFATTPTVFTGSNVIGSGGVYALTVDAKTGNVWGPSQGAGITNYFLAPYTSPVTSVTTSGTLNYAAAVDKNGNTWITNTVTSGASPSSIFMVAHGNPSGTPVAYATPANQGLRSVVVDGNNRLFLDAYTVNKLIEFDPSIGTTGGNPGTFLLTAGGTGFSPSTNAGTSAIASNRTTTIDASGALWLVNASGTQPVLQILGIAAPTVSVLATGQYGVKP
jgi:hypothetical protein